MNTRALGWLFGIIIAGIVIFFGFQWWRSYIVGPTNEYGVGQNATTSPTLAGSGTPVSVASKSSASVAYVVSTLQDAGNFQALWNSTGVASLVKGRGPYTIFVPDNEAFSNLPPNTFVNMTAAEKKRLVEYHVVVGRALDVDAVSSGSIQALSKDMLNFHVNLANHSVQVNSGWVLEEHKASNGVVYVISSVLLPPTKTQ
jgi:uncharacterized surface protein with fasciclin (FAS1) repeats